MILESIYIIILLSIIYYAIKNVIYQPINEGFEIPSQPSSSSNVLKQPNCKYFGSDSQNSQDWQCPDDYPHYSGGTLGVSDQKMTCSGGVAKNAKCQSTKFSGQDAKATAFVSAGSVMEIRIINPGHGYQKPPVIKLLGDGSGAIIKSIISDGQVVGTMIINGGQDYSNPPSVVFNPSQNGFGAITEANIQNGTVAWINVIKSGNDYKTPPIVKINGGGGNGAEAISHVLDGRVTAIEMTKVGSNYTSRPEITLITNIQSDSSSCQFCHLCCQQPKTDQQSKSTSTSTSTPKTDIDTNVDQRLKHTETLLQEILSQIQSTNQQIVTPEPIHQTILMPSNIPSNLSNLNPNANSSHQYRNWATDGIATQSSTADQNLAKYAIDGDLQSYNQTNKGLSWWQVDLLKPIAIRHIKIHNRTDNSEIKSRIVPFQVSIVNSSGAMVAEKKFTTIENVYTWDLIFVIGQSVKIELMSNNYLHMKEVEIWGELGQSCPTYQKQLEKLKTLEQSSQNQLRQQRLQTLIQSCQLLTHTGQQTKSNQIAEQAKAYDKVVEMKTIENQKQVEKATQEMAKIKAEQQELVIMNQKSLKYGLQPLTDKYTKNDIAKVQERLKPYKPRTLTEVEKAQCIGLYNDLNAKKQKADETGQMSQANPLLMPQAQTLATEYENMLKIYTATCD